MTPKENRAIEKVNAAGMLLVFPVRNRKTPRSLWGEFHPRTPMEWEWSDEGDDKVVQMWRLMKKLSDCREVVYTKWYQGRATFISRPLFKALLCLSNRGMGPLTADAKAIYEVLEMDSPLSTKELKRATELQGRFFERRYRKAMKELFEKFLIVAFGEVDDGSFPSLAVGATSLLYEDLWSEAEAMDFREAWELVDRYLPAGTEFRRFLSRSVKPPS